MEMVALSYHLELYILKAVERKRIILMLDKTHK